MPALTLDLRMWRHSGIGRYLRNLVPLVLPQIRVESVVVLGVRALMEGDASHAVLADPRVQFREAPAPIYSVAEQAMALRGVYASGGVLWTPHYNAPLLYGSQRGGSRRGKLVVTLHDIAPLSNPEILSNGIKRAYAKLLIRRAARADAVLCVSKFTADEVHTRLGVPRQRMTVTHPGLDAGWLASAPPAPHVEPDSVPYVLFVGNIKPNKNLSLLLDAFADVRQRVPFRLVLAGRMDGFATGDPAVLTRAKALGERVRFAGEVSDEELRALYAGALAFCLPSTIEGFGLPLLEAMALGCPVLCSRAGALPEVAGEAALLFDATPATGRAQLAELLGGLADNPQLATLRERGYARVQQFSYAQCAAQTAAVLQKLLDAEGGAA
jgi:glycosyltransferase involved in cell wall biosynthesis